MIYSELQDAIIADSHRPDLSGQVVRFIRETEGLIRRDLRAYPLSDTLTDADRSDVTSGVYTLPSGLLEIRAIYSGNNCPPLVQASLDGIKRIYGGAPPVEFAINGDTIEIRGIPAANANLAIQYLGTPDALSSNTDTNSLLTDHESLYIEGSLYFLYKHTQDLELAQVARDSFTDTLERLNQAAGRKLGGASQTPAYNFGCGGSY